MSKCGGYLHHVSTDSCFRRDAASGIFNINFQSLYYSGARILLRKPHKKIWDFKFGYLGGHGFFIITLSLLEGPLLFCLYDTKHHCAESTVFFLCSRSEVYKYPTPSSRWCLEANTCIKFPVISCGIRDGRRLTEASCPSSFFAFSLLITIPPFSSFIGQCCSWDGRYPWLSLG